MFYAQLTHMQTIGALFRTIHNRIGEMKREIANASVLDARAGEI